MHTQIFKYPTAGASSFKEAGSWGAYNHLPRTAYVQRKLSLEGRINIYVAPKDNDTIVTVNTRFILTSHQSGEQELINGVGKVMHRLPITDKPLTISFNTGQTGSADWGTPQDPTTVKCYSIGRLESEILAMARR